MINKHAQREMDDFTIPPKVFTESQLREFHSKVQKYYKDKTQTDGTTLNVFDHDEFAVAYGAMTKTKVGEHIYYRCPENTLVDGKTMSGTERMREMYNLLGQYHDWQRRQDWADGKNTEELDRMSKESAFLNY